MKNNNHHIIDDTMSNLTQLVKDLDDDMSADINVKVLDGDSMREKQNERIVIKAEDNNKYVRKFSFIGKCLFQDVVYIKDTNQKISVALTQKNKLLLFNTENNKNSSYEHFDCFADLVQEDFLPFDILIKIAESSDFIEILDI